MTELDKVQTRKAFDVVALQSSRNVWKSTSDRYRTELNILLDKKFNLNPNDDNYLYDCEDVERKINLMKNNIEIARLRVKERDLSIKVAELVKENMLLKTNQM